MTYEELKPKRGTKQAFIMVDVDPKNRDLLYSLIRKRIESNPAYREIYSLIGAYDFIIRVNVKDESQLKKILKEEIKSIPGVVKTHVLYNIPQSKPNPDRGLESIAGA
jgi:DNA-binding Lrp family transcriptional regulator